ncbi:SPOR domain-containing protein [uncultured Bacteroides sp.]|uniref:HU domain-containing protein n=1 Tax=uncultured Bacteroides sp. TaxID=162156 RepID=UPI0025D91426|nr:SPOR domain-containing protein [uncultured Bacteroides sp.]
MIELAQHIEVLLLENDCVIVPGLGGFIAHYTPAVRVAEENRFLPPTRIVGFNPRLKINDGLLVQSYMTVYGTNFSDATRIVDKSVKELIACLHENGKADMPNIGELRYSIHDTYGFVPYDNKVTTPYLYGLGSFEMQELSALHRSQESESKVIPFTPDVRKEKKHKYEIRINSSYLVNAVAMIAIVALFFFLSAPIENTEVVEANYARLLPGDLFEQIEKQSLAITPIVVRQHNDTKKTKTAQASLPQTAGKKAVAPVAVKEVKVRQQPVAVSVQPKVEVTADAVSISKPAKTIYHIIVASVGNEKDADVMAQQLIAKGHTGAKAIIGGGKTRVSIQSYATEKEAYRALNQLRQDETYRNAWVLKK